MLNIDYDHGPKTSYLANTPRHEREMLQSVAQGDEHAFRLLFLVHHQQLGTHINRITHSAVIAEEVVQDVFLKIWMTRETLQNVDNFKAYLFVVSKNHALNCLKKIARERVQQKKLEQNNKDYPTLEQPESGMYYNLLDEAIDHLPAQQRRVYLLSRHNRLKYAEIAEQLKVSRETVKKYLQIATVSITDYVRTHLDALSIVLITIKTFFIFFNN